MLQPVITVLADNRILIMQLFIQLRTVPIPDQAGASTCA